VNFFLVIIIVVVATLATGLANRYQQRACMERCVAGRAVEQCEVVCR
jgi:putative copper export protein